MEVALKKDVRRTDLIVNEGQNAAIYLGKLGLAILSVIPQIHVDLDMHGLVSSAGDNSNLQLPSKSLLNCPLFLYYTIIIYIINIYIS
jgi:hypothetical protein